MDQLRKASLLKPLLIGSLFCARVYNTVDNVIGKPSAYYIQKILEHLNVSKEKCLIISDRLETNILMGKSYNIPTCLVLTGISACTMFLKNRTKLYNTEFIRAV
ncbi:HAD hydrolase-like protein [Terribacillus aidingensis]|uniref:HAD hydrolase-like protein n=1 Tax=Terribacillus aidingensis TaxID=586416 RepID=UPI00344F872A